MTEHTATRQSSLFTFATWYGFGDLYGVADSRETALKTTHAVNYGLPDWPSHSEWLVPRPALETKP